MTWYTYLAVHPITKIAGYAGITDHISTHRPLKIFRTLRIRRWLKELAERQLTPEIRVAGAHLSRLAAAAHLTRLLDDNPALLNKRANVPRATRSATRSGSG